MLLQTLEYSIAEHCDRSSREDAGVVITVASAIDYLLVTMVQTALDWCAHLSFRLAEFDGLCRQLTVR